MLPDGSGVDVCRELRGWTPGADRRPLGRQRGAEKVEALDAGADDYVTKPFGVDELLARLRAALRRAGPSRSPSSRSASSRSISRSGACTAPASPLQLTPHEFELLRVLAQNEGKLMTHRMILREVWGPPTRTESHYLHVYVSQLRRKLEVDPARPQYLRTEPGAGYRLVSPA